MKSLITTLFLFLSASIRSFDDPLPDAKLKDLPIHISISRIVSEKPMVFFITGDGGYTRFDKSFCKELAESGFSVVALDALKYFWNEKTPESTTVDVEGIISLYQAKWHKDQVIIIGYSLGADVLPFVYNRLNKSLQDQIKSMVLMSPAIAGDFEIHVTDMLNLSGTTKKFDVASEINKVRKVKILCIYGSEEKAEIKGKTKNKDLTFVTITGGHHYDDAYRNLVSAITAHSNK